MDYIIKLNFAGSGDFVWRKVIHSDELFKEVTTLHKGDVGTIQKIMAELGDKIPHNQDVLFKLENKKLMCLLPRTIEAVYGEGNIEIARNVLIFWLKRDQKGLRKVTYTVPGPQGELFGKAKGATDIGEYSIRKTVETLLPIITHQIDDLIKITDDKDRIIVHIKGHSRGGVSANFVLKNLSARYKNEKKVQIFTTQFDPVPGPQTIAKMGASDRGDPPEPQYTKPEEYEEIYLDDMINSAVVYSLQSKKTGMQQEFKMQKVHNAKVVVLMDENHAVGLYDTSTKDGKTVKRRYNLIVDGKLSEFSPGKLCTIPSGIYWATNNQQTQRFELTKIGSGNYAKLVDILCEKAVSERKNFLISVVYEKVLTEQVIKQQLVRENIDRTLDKLRKLFNNDDEFLSILKEVETYIDTPDERRALLFFDKLKKTPNIRNYKVRTYVLNMLQTSFKI